MAETNPTVAAVRFRWSDKTYDYFVPDGITPAVGQEVVVETRNGETKATIVEIKPASEAATKTILRVSEAKAKDGQ